MGSRPSQFPYTQDGPLRLYSTSELLNLPAPTWLVDKIIPAGGAIALWGMPGAAKSFIAIDVAMSVAAGRDWNDHTVDRGFVVYVSAEGGAGIGKRARAWLQANGVSAREADIAWLVESLHVGLGSDQLEAFCDRLETEVRRDPTLIVIDTLARCFEGDENLQEDMNHFVAGVDLLRKRFNCTVLVVHHSRLDGTRERGSSSFHGAMDMMMSAEKHEQQVVIKCKKQKDDEEFDDIPLELVKVDGTDSCVVQRDHTIVNEAQMLDQMVDALQQVQPSTWDNWQATTGFTKSKFMKGYTKLKSTGRVNKTSGLWAVVTQIGAVVG